MKHKTNGYFRHMFGAFGFSLRCLGWSIQAAVHGCIPAVLQNTTEKVARRTARMYRDSRRSHADVA